MGSAPVPYLNALSEEQARAELLRCCGSRRWAERVAAARPFANDAALHAAADGAWWQLDPVDWREAFAAHPRIGERAGGWAGREQAGMSGATDEMRAAFAAANAEYEQRFGHVFLICATGRGAAEMLADLRRRLANDPASELRVAAAEQAKITRLRLERLGGA